VQNPPYLNSGLSAVSLPAKRNPLFKRQPFWYKPPLGREVAAAGDECEEEADMELSSPTDESVADFAPLRLVLQPTGAVLEVNLPEVVVGRHSAAEVCLPLPDVSRRHCRIVHADEKWEIIDLESLNGVWVNDRSVARAVLNHGDRLRLGGFTFMVDLSMPTSAADGATDGVLRSIFSALPPADDASEQPRRRAS
jgi:pSer/pThr/pTyr-binding forkhead associated (FHA) protein